MDEQHEVPKEEGRDADWRTDAGFWFRPGDLPERPRRMAHGVYGNGRLARRGDMESLLAARGKEREDNVAEREAHGLRFSESAVLVETCANGSVLAPVADCDLYLPPSLREKHLLLIGGTGAGKTTKTILPQIFSDIRDPQRTLIVIDAKGCVLFEYMVALAAKYRPGQPVHQINMMRPARNTLVWNAVSSIESRADALEMAHAVCAAVDVGKDIKDPFWLNSSIALLADILLAMALDPSHEVERSVAGARAIVDAYPMGMAEFADAHPAGDPYPREGFPAIYRALEGSSGVTQQSVVADLSQRLVMYGSEEIAACTGGPNELDLRELIASAGILVLEVWESDRDQLLPLTNLFVSRVFTTLIRLATEQPDGRLPCGVSLILDELGSAMGELPNFETRLSTLRSRGVSITGAVQTLGQLSNLYGSGPAEAIVSNFNTKVFLGGGLGVKDAAFASTLSGTMTALAATLTDVEREGVLISSESLVPVARPVLLPEEVSRPTVHPLLGPPATVFPPDTPPFYAYLTPAYQLPQMAWAIAPRERKPLVKSTPPPTAKSQPVESVEAQIDRLKRELGWAEISDRAKSWWQAQERHWRQKPGELLNRLHSLHECLALYQRIERPQGVLFDEFFDAIQRSGTVDFVGNVSFYKWSLIVRWEHQRDRGSL